MRNFFWHGLIQQRCLMRHVCKPATFPLEGLMGKKHCKLVQQLFLHKDQQQHLNTCITCCRWGVNVVAFVITAVLGEWLCLRREMQDIPIGEPLPAAVTNQDVKTLMDPQSILFIIFKHTSSAMPGSKPQAALGCRAYPLSSLPCRGHQVSAC